MRPVLTAAEMREADRRTIEDHGVPGVTLMERAGSAVAAVVRERWPGARVSVLCGRGNNGGDGFVIARQLGARAWLVGRRDDVKGDARAHLDLLLEGGGSVAEVVDESGWQRVQAEALAADVIVDALLGTGSHDAPTGATASVIASLAASSTPVVAVDIPSGLPSDGQSPSWPVPHAVVTVTFAAPKVGLVLSPGCELAGELVVADIGIPASELGDPAIGLLEASDVRAAYGGPRDRAAHKGRFGHVLVVAGSVGKSGAATLAGLSALRGGAGLVTVATPEPVLALVAGSRAELMTEPLPHAQGAVSAAAIDVVLEMAARRDAVVLGPGLGTTPGAARFVRELVARCPVPLVVDADGLNALAAAPFDVLREDVPVILTPHPGEMARLTRGNVAGVQRARLDSARALARQSGAVVVLKGQRTLVTRPDGRTAVNPTGNPGMATGGTGDVLAGLIGALLARGGEAWLLAGGAAYLHGLAGDIAARELGEEGLLAGDLIEALPEALRTVGVGRA